MPLKPNIFIKLHKSLDFKSNYIKKYPLDFENAIEKTLVEKYGTNSFSIERHINNNELDKLTKIESHIFANMSVFSETCPIPNILSSKVLKNEIIYIFENAHEIVKEELKISRKNKA